MKLVTNTQTTETTPDALFGFTDSIAFAALIFIALFAIITPLVFYIIRELNEKNPVRKTLFLSGGAGLLLAALCFITIASLVTPEPEMAECLQPVGQIEI